MSLILKSVITAIIVGVITMYKYDVLVSVINGVLIGSIVFMVSSK